MRKLHILKSLVDFLFITTSCVVPFLILGMPTVFILSENITSDFLKINITESITILHKVFFAIFLLSYLLIYYTIYKFRLVLNEFVRARIFTEKVIANLKSAGNILMIAGLLMIISEVGFNLIIESIISFNFGISTHYLCICFGLFFVVLSEIFKVSKNMKQENDLTI
ncbi:DUF2975 domain-containing protein [Tenacibaculum insulae]|uniref:DUF2975 domain-containing protein n=1 Tax=Tenacibaculum insulae TaxID=2029677 RepID=UPI003AB2BA07